MDQDDRGDGLTGNKNIYNSGDWGNGNSGWTDAGSSGSSQNDEQVARAILVVIAVIAGVIVIPIALVVAVFYYLFFRIARWRPLPQCIVAAVISVIGMMRFIGMGMFSPMVSTIRGVITAHDAITESLRVIASSWMSTSISLGLAVGPWIAVVISMLMIRKMATSPWLVVNEGLPIRWMYQFRFRPTPIDLIRRHAVVRAIRSDTLHPWHRRDMVPLGVEEHPLNPDENPLRNRDFQVISRAEDEVPKHTMVTGAAGSGKTVTLKSMMTRDIDNHKTIFVID